MANAVVTTRGRQASLAVLTEGYTPAGPTTMILMRSGHVFVTDPDTVAAIVADEIAATGYARQVVAFDPPVTDPDGTVKQASTDTCFGLVGGAVDDTVSGWYLFEDSGDDATSIVTACVEFVTEKTTDGTELIVRPVVWVWRPTAF